MIFQLNPETASWRAFGFPDPRGYPAAIPIIGLRWAIWERNRAVTGFEKSFEDFLDPNLANMGSIDLDLSVLRPSSYVRTIDEDLEWLCLSYLRPDKLEDYLLGNISVSVARWNLNDLLTEAAGGDPDDVVWGFPESDQWPEFYPENYLPWLIQRYKAVKLIRYLNLENDYHFCTDGFRGEWGKGPTPDAALADAEKNGYEFFNEVGIRFPYLGYRRRSPFEVDTAKYDQFSMLNITKCYLNLEYKHLKVIPPAFLGVIISDQDYDQPAPGVPGPGYHQFTADEDGVFFGYKTPFWQGMTLPELPWENPTISFGTEFVDDHHGYADYGAIFHFSAEDPQRSTAE